MKCKHRPKETIKAMFTYDNIFTCKKCGKNIWYKNDRWDYRHEMGILAVPVVVFSGVFGILIGIFTSKEIGIYASLVLLALLYALGMWVYVTVYAEFVSSEDEKEKPKRIKLNE
ncbi:MAG: hypothetical protein IJ466_06150 [Clostridia bacterium]|nr:hypothetical protein [Clostridia bacterium]